MIITVQYGGKNNNRYVNKVHTLQKRTGKIILNKPMRSPSVGLYKELNWLSFSDRCKYHSAVHVYKTLNSMAPTYLSEILKCSQNEKYSLRSANRHDLVLNIKPRTNLIQNTFAYYSMKIWNNIPPSL